MPNWFFIAVVTPGMFLAGWAGLESYQRNPETIWVTLLVAFGIWCGIVGHAIDSDRNAKRK